MLFISASPRALVNEPYNCEDAMYTILDISLAVPLLARANARISGHTISASISVFRCINALAYSLGSPS